MPAANFSYSLSSPLYIQSSRIPCQLTLSTTSVSLVRSLSSCSCVTSVAFSLVSASALTHHCPQPSKVILLRGVRRRHFPTQNPPGASSSGLRGPPLHLPLFSDSLSCHGGARWPQHTQACSCPCLRAFVLAALSASEVISSDSLFPNLLQAFALISPVAFFDRLFKRTRHLLLLFCPYLIFLHSISNHMACMLLSHFSRVRLCDPMDHGPPGSSVHGILQARILEWVAMFLLQW